jgi:hypothetical protein
VPGLFLPGTNLAVEANLIGLWTLDQTSGTVAYDMSGNGNDGTLMGDPMWTVGKIGGALELDGTGDYVNCGNGDILNITRQVTLAAWVKADSDFAYPDWSGIIMRGGPNIDTFALYYNGPGQQIGFKTTGTNPSWMAVPAAGLFDDEWHHVAATYDGTKKLIYLDDEQIGTMDSTGSIETSTGRLLLGAGRDLTQPTHLLVGLLDDARIYDGALTQIGIQSIMEGGEGYPYALGPSPADGAFIMDTWATLGWVPGDFAVSHNVYLGDNFDEVNEATPDSEVYRGNQTLIFYVAGFPGYAYPNGLVPGTTYYWRIDEVNDADPNSPWKGNVWSFSVPSKSAYGPVPADNAEFVPLDVKLTWTPGFGAKLHTVYFGEDFDTVNEATGGAAIGVVSYTPGPLKLAKTYYWRVDEFDGSGTYKGDVWSFTTAGAVTGPNPADGAVDVKPSQTLSWVAGAVAASHEVYLGVDADAVKNATKSSPEYKGAKALGEESYVPGKLIFNTTYYWRIDEVNGVNPDSPWAGNVWSFTTGDFFVIDDFEDYDAGDNQIWYAWHDGLGYGTPGTAGYYAGNGTGAAVGDENSPSYTEETIVHGGSKSMPVNYDNNKQGYSKYSEVELKMTDQRDWTEQGVAELSLWFRGYPASVGSFVEAPAGTFTMTASGADIWSVNGVEADEFHFAYKTLTGAGSIITKVQSVDNTNGWAKAGVMIRESLNPDSAHAFAAITPANGVAAQGRPSTGGVSFNTNQTGITAPYWVKLERSVSGNFTVSHSANGTSWQAVTGATPQNIPMGSNVYIGLALTAHDAALMCRAVFSNVTTSGSVSGQWSNQDIGILSNDGEPLYVAVSNTAGSPVIVVNDNPAAAQIDAWTEWVIPLQVFADQGITLTNVDRIAIGLGTRGNMTTPGGSGKMFIDDIRLNKLEEAAE